MWIENSIYVNNPNVNNPPEINNESDYDILERYTNKAQQVLNKLPWIKITK